MLVFHMWDIQHKCMFDYTLLCCLVLQSMMSASADSTTVTRTPCASTWSEATVAPVSPATLGMEQCAKVSITVLVLIFIHLFWYLIDLQDITKLLNSGDIFVGHNLTLHHLTLHCRVYRLRIKSATTEQLMLLRFIHPEEPAVIQFDMLCLMFCRFCTKHKQTSFSSSRATLDEWAAHSHGKSCFFILVPMLSGYSCHTAHVSRSLPYFLKVLQNIQWKGSFHTVSMPVC